MNISAPCNCLFILLVVVSMIRLRIHVDKTNSLRSLYTQAVPFFLLFFPLPCSDFNDIWEYGRLGKLFWKSVLPSDKTKSKAESVGCSSEHTPFLNLSRMTTWNTRRGRRARRGKTMTEGRRRKRICDELK